MASTYFTGPDFVPPVDDMTLPQMFLDGVFQHPSAPQEPTDIPCLIDDKTGRKVFLDELRTRTQYLARAMKGKWNIGSGDNIVIFSPNHTDYPVCIWAAHRLGVAIATSSPGLTVDELIYQLQIVKPRLIVTHPLINDIAEEAAISIGLPSSRIVNLNTGQTSAGFSGITIEDLVRDGRSLPPFEELRLAPGEAKRKIAFLCFSSGTTGKPKAVTISHYNVICNITQIATTKKVNEAYAPWEERQLRPGDICSGVLPFYHIYGLVANLLFLIFSKITLVVTEKFDFAQMLDNIVRYRITTLMIVPPQVVLFCKHPLAKNADLSSLRCCIIAGAPVTEALTKQFVDRIPHVQLGQAYGMTETSPSVSIWPVTQRVGTLGSGGQLIAGTIAKVVKADGTLGKVRERGELYVKGGQNTMGYYQNDAATKEVFVDGWVRTGDEVFFDQNGDLFVVDRIKEIIKVKGFQVAPAELEGHLLNHPDIADAAVIGIPDEYAGEVPLAFVVLQPEIFNRVKKNEKLANDTRADIFKHISSAVSQYKWPVGGIEFIESLPKIPSGKILRRVLREQVTATRLLRTKL